MEDTLMQPFWCSSGWISEAEIKDPQQIVLTWGYPCAGVVRSHLVWHLIQEWWLPWDDLRSPSLSKMWSLLQSWNLYFRPLIGLLIFLSQSRGAGLADHGLMGYHELGRPNWEARAGSEGEQVLSRAIVAKYWGWGWSQWLLIMAKRDT